MDRAKSILSGEPQTDEYQRDDLLACHKWDEYEEDGPMDLEDLLDQELDKAFGTKRK